jgi:hypothetical protein
VYVFGRFRGHLGRFRGHLGRFRVHLGRFRGHLGRFRGHLGSSVSARDEILLDLGFVPSLNAGWQPLHRMPYRHGRSPVSLLAADVDAALAANLNLPGTAVSVTSDDNVTVLEPGASAAAAAQRRSLRMRLALPNPRPLQPFHRSLLQTRFTLFLVSLPKESSANGHLSDLLGGGTPAMNRTLCP